MLYFCSLCQSLENLGFLYFQPQDYKRMLDLLPDVVKLEKGGLQKMYILCKFTKRESTTFKVEPLIPKYERTILRSDYRCSVCV